MDECTVQGRNSNDYALNQKPELLQPRLSCKMFFSTKFPKFPLYFHSFQLFPVNCFQPWKFLEFVTLLISQGSLLVLFRNLSNNGAKDTTGSIQKLAAPVSGKRLAFWHNTGNQRTVSKESEIQQVRERQERAGSVRCAGQIFYHSVHVTSQRWRGEGEGMCGSV